MPTILITGANRGLGFEFARQYSQEDWHVIATCRNLGQATHLESLSGKIEIKRLDVSDFSSIEECSDNLGEIPIDVLLLNAGVFPQKGTPLAGTDFKIWKDFGYSKNDLNKIDMGGATAPRIPKVSVQDMRSVISALTMKNSGTFLNFDGKELLW